MLDIARLKAARERKKITQKQAAEAAGMTLGRWNDIESGRRANITLKSLDRIAKVLDISPQDLLNSPEGPQSTAKSFSRGP